MKIFTPFASKVPEVMEVEETQDVRYRYAEQKEFKSDNPWINYQLEGMFGNWDKK